MSRLVEVFVSLCIAFRSAENARILAVYPTPSISHQLPFRQLTLDLVKRGHEVVVITPHAAFSNGTAPVNLKEIDVHDISYDLWKKKFGSTGTGKTEDVQKQIRTGYEVMLEIFLKQLQLPAVQHVLYNSTFDLLILESWVRSTLIFSHFHKVPVIQISSFGGFFGQFEAFGAPNHQLLYPLASWQKINKPSLWSKFSELLVYFSTYFEYKEFEKFETKLLRRSFAPDMPDLKELVNNVDMLFLNVYPMWDSNRPVPPNLIYIGGIHQIQPQVLPSELETYLNSSKNGVIYVSFGSNVFPSTLPPNYIQIMVNVFSQLPYDILWKWDKDELPGRTQNIRIAKWFPQPDLLRHPNIKLFITQAGLQSTDEAISAGVPLLAIPMLGDQWFNAERYVQFQIGLQLGIETMTEVDLKMAVQELIGDPSYRKNVVRVRNLMYDQPQTALDRAVWWIEHLLRHGGGKHLRATGANISWAEYLELELLCVFIISVVTVSCLLCFVLFRIIKFLKSYKSKVD